MNTRGETSVIEVIIIFVIIVIISLIAYPAWRSAKSDERQRRAVAIAEAQDAERQPAEATTTTPVLPKDSDRFAVLSRQYVPGYCNSEITVVRDLKTYGEYMILITANGCAVHEIKPGIK